MSDSVPQISVIIPTWNEEANIADCLRWILRAKVHEILVVDGGSQDRTIEIADSMGASVIESKPGRGQQLKLGAEQATGHILQFVHADCWLDSRFVQQLSVLNQHRKTGFWGCYHQKIRDRRWIYRVFEKGNDFRAAWQQRPFGDQAMFVSRDLYDLVRGFRSIPLMEDLDLSKRLARIGRPKMLNGPIWISSRRWQANGPIRQTFINWRLQWRWSRGVDADTLAKEYQSR